MKQLMERYNEAQEKADPYARAPRAGWMEAGRRVAEKSNDRVTTPIPPKSRKNQMQLICQTARKKPGSLDFQGFRGLSRWQREKDSNPHKQSQSLSCYPYTIPLFCFFALGRGPERIIYYSYIFQNVNTFF